MEIASSEYPPPEARTLTVVIPARDEAPHLAALVTSVKKLLPEAEVIVVDDGSVDGCGETAITAGARVIRHPYPLGNGAAVRRGIRAARRDWVLVMDGDGQHPPGEIPKLLEGAAPYRLTVGARPLSRQPLIRAAGNRVFNGLAGWVCNVEVADLTSGFRLYYRKAVLPLLPLFPNGFSSPATGTLGMIRSGLPVRFVTIEPGPAQRASHLSPWADGVRFLVIIFRIATLYSPLKVFLPLSVLLFFAGGTYLGFHIVRYQTFPPAALFTLTSAVLVLGLGLISEQISQIRFSRTEEDIRE